MDIAVLHVVNCKSDIIIDKTLCNYMHDSVTLYIVTCSNPVFYYQFIHKHFAHKRININVHKRSKTSLECLNVKC